MIPYLTTYVKYSVDLLDFVSFDTTLVCRVRLRPSLYPQKSERVLLRGENVGSSTSRVIAPFRRLSGLRRHVDIIM